MESYFVQPKFRKVLDGLYADARKSDPLVRESLSNDSNENDTAEEHFRKRKDLYMPVGPEFGNLLYSSARAIHAKTIVEFGTSFGISTLYLAASIGDNGGGTVITSEFISEKSDRAKANVNEAGLGKYVEYRVGDALKTLKQNLPAEIDLLFLDGAKDLYFDVLKIVEPVLRTGALILADNTDHEGLENFLAHVRNPTNGYVSSAILTGTATRNGGHEISIKI